LGRHVDIELPDGRRLTGTVQDIDPSGALLVEVGGRIEVVVSGTVRDHGAAIEGAAIEGAAIEGSAS
jgi:biotin-(acetyl-CoA carboxylase) ligase